MKALCFDEKLSLREVEKPQRGPGEALIAVTLAGICGTDRQILNGYSGFWGIPGHEFVGRVVECDDVGLIGKRVVGEINITCRACDWCRRGLGRHCSHRAVIGIINRPRFSTAHRSRNQLVHPDWYAAVLGATHTIHASKGNFGRGAGRN